MNRSLNVWLFVLFLACVLAWPFARGTFVGKSQIGGFVAFYCAGQAVREHRDPYRVEPLRSCERASPYNFGAGLPEPAPLPPFALAFFAALSLLPLSAAFGVYTLLLIAATALAAWALNRLTGFGIFFIGAALLVTDLYHNMIFGEIPPLVVGALCAAALLVERGKFVLAALVAAVSLVEPHAAAPALIAMFVAFAATRIPLIAIGVGLVALSGTTFGVSGTLEYFTQVLPIHAMSEVWANDQYSLTWVMHELGVGDVSAVRIGMLSYVAACTIGIVTAMRLAKHFGRPSFVVLVPSAFAMIGGSFIHDLQIPIALPAAMVLLSAVAPKQRFLTLLAIIGMVAPWNTLIVVGLPAVAIVVWTSNVAQPLHVRQRAILTAAVCAGYVVILGGLLALPDHLKGHYPPNVPLAAAPEDFASSAWGHFVRVSPYGEASLRTIVRKIPLWTALLLFAFCAVRPLNASRTTRRAAVQLPAESISTPSPR